MQSALLPCQRCASNFSNAACQQLIPPEVSCPCKIAASPGQQKQLWQWCPVVLPVVCVAVALLANVAALGVADA
jgi:hypothetical protein